MADGFERSCRENSLTDRQSYRFFFNPICIVPYNAENTVETIYSVLDMGPGPWEATFHFPQWENYVATAIFMFLAAWCMD